MAAVGRKTEHVKILQDLGYDPWEIENDDDMLSALKASINDLSRENPSDGRIPMLQAAVKGLRKPKFKEKKTTIKGDKFMGKENKNPAPITDKSKLLPGAGFEPKDAAPEPPEAEQSGDDSKVDKIIQFLNGEVKDKLDEINSSIGEIKDVVGAQGDLAEERDEDMRQALLAARKRKREGKLEKKKTIKDKMLDEVTKPVGNFLSKLIRFVTMTYVGSVINFIMKIIKNPMSWFDPLKQFLNLFISFINLMMRWSFKITGGPINAIIDGINGGVQGLLGVLNNITSKFKLPPITIPEIPTISGPAQIPFIPLASGGVEKEAVAMSGGGEVPEVEGEPGVDGVDGEVGITGEPGADGLVPEGSDGVQGNQGIPGTPGAPGDSATVGDSFFGEKKKTEEKDIAKGMSGGGIVHPKRFNKGGKVPGSGTGDTVPAMLTPGEFVMSKGAVDQIGVDNLMAMNKEGGGTNQPKMMKFAGGGVVPDIDTPSKKSGKVVVIGGGGGSSAPRGVASSGSSGSGRRFSSTDPNNMTIPVVKSLYNIMS